ncbi:MAG: hypothetical protein ACE149_19450 [Armatimonadota bacterium]
MRFADLMRHCVEIGMGADYRGREVSLRCRHREAERVVKLAGIKGRAAERLLHDWPVYGDVAWNGGNANHEVRRLMVGINMTTSAVLRARELNANGWGIDLLFVHHPAAGEQRIPKELQRYLRYAVLELDARSLAAFFDMPVASARRIAAINHQSLEQQRADFALPPGRQPDPVDLAAMFGFPFYSCHTPCDNHLFWGIHEVLLQQPRTLGDFVEAVLAIPEYARFRRERHEMPEVIAGGKRALLGKVWNADTQCLISCLNEEVIKEIAKAGFDTIVGVIGGARGNTARLCQKHGLNAVHLPHDPSDNLGINRLLDRLIEIEPLDILCTGDFYRVERGQGGSGDLGRFATRRRKSLGMA